LALFASFLSLEPVTGETVVESQKQKKTPQAAASATANK